MNALGLAGSTKIQESGPENGSAASPPPECTVCTSKPDSENKVFLTDAIERSICLPESESKNVKTPTNSDLPSVPRSSQESVLLSFTSNKNEIATEKCAITLPGVDYKKDSSILEWGSGRENEPNLPTPTNVSGSGMVLMRARTEHKICDLYNTDVS